MSELAEITTLTLIVLTVFGAWWLVSARVQSEMTSAPTEPTAHANPLVAAHGVASHIGG